MPTVTIRFDGICCHINPPGGSPITVKRRAVLPDIHNHVRYIEVYTNDIDSAANPDFTFTSQYPRFNDSFRHVPIGNVKIELLNITSTTFQVLPSFDQRIPRLRDVEPRFNAVKQALLKPTISASENVSYFDMNVGVLSSGPSEGFRTVFDPPRNWPVRHLGQWAQLDVEVSGTAPMLRVTDLQSGTVRQLVLKDGADLITIGNQTLLDIHGQAGASGHFVHYYDLADPRPANPVPEPKIGLGLGIGCSDSQWP